MATFPMNRADLRAIRFTLAVIWLVTGMLALCVYPKEDSVNLLARIGLHGSTALAILYLTAALDIFLGLLTLISSSKLLWIIQACFVIGYTLVISIWLPEFWLHPFGPILKNLPILLMLWLLYKNEGVTR